jgi:hypothetical protein
MSSRRQQYGDEISKLPVFPECCRQPNGGCSLDLPPKKWTGLGRHTLSESWADVAQGRMQATGIVEDFDILEEVSARLAAGAINPMVNPLGLEAVEEAFHWRVVQTIALTAHRGRYA